MQFDIHNMSHFVLTVQVAWVYQLFSSNSDLFQIIISNLGFVGFCFIIHFLKVFFKLFMKEQVLLMERAKCDL